MRINHRQFGLDGFQPDKAPDTLAVGAVSGGYNLRPTRFGWEKSDGFRESSIEPGNTRNHLSFWSPNRGDIRWFIAGESSIKMASGGTITDVSRVGGYTAAGKSLWDSLNFNGVPILNNVVDRPQFFTEGASFGDLTGIDAGVRFRCLGKFKSYLIGLAPDFGAGFQDDSVWWSHPADPGTIPPNWDYADPASDSGIAQLPSPGYIVTELELGDTGIIYKSDSIWLMQFIGGQFIFKFTLKFDGQGILNKNCVTDFEGRHFVVTQSDMIVHDGYQLQSVAEGRVKEYFLADVDSDKFGNVFVVKNPSTTEILVFYPSKDATTDYCDKCLVWNWRDNTWTTLLVPNVKHASYGYEITGVDITWETYATSWARRGSWKTPEDLRQFAPVLHYATEDFSKILAASGNSLVVNEPLVAVWERLDMILGGISRDGVPYQDYEREKVVRELVFDVDTADEFDVYIGTKGSLDDAVEWELAGTINPVVDRRLHLLYTTAFLSVRIVSTAPYFRLRNIAVVFELAGEVWT